MSKQKKILTEEEIKERKRIHTERERARRARLKAEDPEYYKKNYQKYKNYFQQASKEYYYKNKDAVLEREKKRRNTTEEKARKKEYNKQYREKNWYWIKKDQQEYVRRREKESPEFKLKRRLRERTRDALDYHRFIKIDSFTKAIGCTPQELREHVEHLYELCHYTNVRPMWSVENSARGNKYEPDSE